jgi:hypothetical protein
MPQLGGPGAKGFTSMRKAIMLGAAVLIGSAGFASLQVTGASAAVPNIGTNPYTINVTGGGATPAAAEANAASRVPSNCREGGIISGPSYVDGEWVVTVRAVCTDPNE